MYPDIPAFHSTLFIWANEKSAWYFIPVPAEHNDALRFFAGHEKRGWGAIKVQAQIGDSIWTTSIFPDKSRGCYLLPVKAEIRKRQKMDTETPAAVKLTIIAS